MKKQLREKDVDTVGSTGYQVQGYRLQRFHHLVGRLLTIIDSCGLEEKQNNAIKDLIKNEIWTMWDSPQYTYSYEDVIGGEDKLIID